MNLAFQALLFFVLLLPGLLLRSNYNGRIAKELVLPQNYPPFSHEAIRVLVYAALLNAVWVFLSNLVGQRFNFHVDLVSVLFLLMGDYSDAQLQQQAISSVTDHPVKVSLYFSSIYGFSTYFGFKLHKTIREYELDKKYRFLRFNNQWHYLLTGEIMEFPEAGETPTKVDFVLVSAVVDSFVYVGTVADYELDGRGNLARLTLQQAYRRKLCSDAGNDASAQNDLENDPRYYRIKGDYFLLDCEKTRNINIDYWYLPEAEDADTRCQKDPTDPTASPGDTVPAP